MKISTSSLVCGIIIVLTSAFKANASFILTLQPSAAHGQDWDAVVENFYPSTNFATSTEFQSYIWTCGGPSCVGRSLINFDLSALPANATITNATLYLFADVTAADGVSGQPTYGSNDAGWVQRITAPWTITGVNWNNQPSTTTVDEVAIPQSSSTAENYTLNVTALYQDIHSSGNNYGIEMLHQQEVTYYNSLIFGSTNNADSNLHPKLVIIYDTVMSVDTGGTHCITLHPSAALGQDWDAVVENFYPSTNFATSTEFQSYIWTCGGPSCVGRSLINFDLSALPANATITNATLYLFADVTAADGVSGQPTYGSNDAGWVQRITAPWTITGVNWNNQPSTTTVDEVAIPQSSSTAENYTLNVTALYQDIHSSGNNYGIEMLHQQEVTYYNSLIFGSTNNADSNLHPKLQICYNVPAGVNSITKTNIQFDIYPNPATDKVVFKTSIQQEGGNYYVEMFDTRGASVKTVKLYPYMTTISTDGMARGMYFYRIMNGNVPLKTGKLVLQ